jgi:probable F420-dependent oxidoreductase
MGGRLKIDAEIAVASPAEASVLAAKAEEYGFDCLWANEIKHDPFVQLALAAASTTKIELGTSIALAFTRSPMTLAYTAWDLQNLSKGRLILGLGSQVKGHIERRFGMKWEAPAPKMKDVVLALRSVWGSWQDETRLDYRGRFFHLDLMTPFFNPGPIERPVIPVYIAAVNAGMCRVAGMVADGVHIHPFHTVKYLREVVRPAVAEGASGASRKKEEVALAASVFAAVGESESEVQAVREAARQQIAFYASTRSYRKVLELHGLEDVGERLHALSVKGEWEAMGKEVTNEMLDEFVVQGSWSEIGSIVLKRYGGLVDRVRMYLPFDGDQKWRKLVSGFRA